MIVNKNDWLRCLRIAASVSNPTVKFAPDGFFGVLAKYRAFAVFGKSVPLHSEIAFADIDEVIGNLKVIKDQELNVEISNGWLTFAKTNQIYSCKTIPPELIPNYSENNWVFDDWLNVLLSYEALSQLNAIVKATKAYFVEFYFENGWLMAKVGGKFNFWRVVLDVGFMPCTFKVAADNLSKALSLLDESWILLSFKFQPAILRIKTQGVSQHSFAWYLGALREDVENEPRQTQRREGLLLSFYR